jgi:hypothetical protein
VTSSVSRWNGFHGISVQGGSRAHVARDVTTGNITPGVRRAAGIDVSSGSLDALVERNVSHDNDDSGLEIYTGSAGALVRRNVTYDNGDHGIDVSASAQATVVSNTSVSNSAAGLNVEGGSTGATLRDNISAHAARAVSGWTRHPCRAPRSTTIWSSSPTAARRGSNGTVSGIGASPVFVEQRTRSGTGAQATRGSLPSGPGTWSWDRPPRPSTLPTPGPLDGAPATRPVPAPSTPPRSPTQVLDRSGTPTWARWSGLLPGHGSTWPTGWSTSVGPTAPMPRPRPVRRTRTSCGTGSSAGPSAPPTGRGHARRCASSTGRAGSESRCGYAATSDWWTAPSAA